MKVRTNYTLKSACLGFKPDGIDDGAAMCWYYPSDQLTLWREPAETVEVWEVVKRIDDQIDITTHTSQEAAQKYAAACVRGKILTIRHKETITVEQPNDQ